MVVVGVLLGYWSSAGELLRQLQDVHGTKKQKTISHYQFRKAIALALLDPDTYWPNRMKSKPVQNENESSVSGTKASSKRGSDSVDTSGTRLIKKTGHPQLPTTHFAHVQGTSQPISNQLGGTLAQSSQQ